MFTDAGAHFIQYNTPGYSLVRVQTDEHTNNSVMLENDMAISEKH